MLKKKKKVNVKQERKLTLATRSLYTLAVIILNLKIQKII